MFTKELRMGDVNHDRSKTAIGKTYFGTDIYQMDMSELELRFVGQMAQRHVNLSRTLWDEILPKLEDRDKEAYAVLYGHSVSDQLTMSEVFVVGQCFKNAVFAAWLLNGRALRSHKWEIAYTDLHAALVNKHNHKVIDPTFEAHPQASGNDVWQHGTMVCLMYETLGKGNSVSGIPRLSFQEMLEYSSFLTEDPDFVAFVNFVRE
jgi:hypothetical protein